MHWTCTRAVGSQRPKFKSDLGQVLIPPLFSSLHSAHPVNKGKMPQNTFSISLQTGIIPCY